MMVPSHLLCFLVFLLFWGLEFLVFFFSQATQPVVRCTTGSKRDCRPMTTGFMFYSFILLPSTSSIHPSFIHPFSSMLDLATRTMKRIGMVLLKIRARATGIGLPEQMVTRSMLYFMTTRTSMSHARVHSSSSCASQPSSC